MGSKIYFMNEKDNLKSVSDMINYIGRLFTSSGNTIISTNEGWSYASGYLSQKKDKMQPITLGKYPQDAYAKVIFQMFSEIKPISETNAKMAMLLLIETLKVCFTLLYSGHDIKWLRDNLSYISEKILSELDNAVIPYSDEVHLNKMLEDDLHDAELAESIAEAVKKFGTSGLIQVEESDLLQSYFSVKEGFLIQKGFMKRYMATDTDKLKTVLNNPVILISELPIMDIEEILPYMTLAVKEKRPLLIIAEHVEDKPLKALEINKRNSGFIYAAVHAPKFGTERKFFLRDIANIVGAKVICTENGGFEMAQNPTGGAKKAVLDKDKTIIYGADGKKEELASAKSHIKKLISETKDQTQNEFLRERLALLSDEIGVVHVACLESDAESKKEAVRQEIEVIRSAAVHGVLPGMGESIKNAMEAVAIMDTENSFIKLMLPVFNKTHKLMNELNIYEIKDGFDSAFAVKNIIEKTFSAAGALASVAAVVNK